MVGLLLGTAVYQMLEWVVSVWKKRKKKSIMRGTLSIHTCTNSMTVQIHCRWRQGCWPAIQVAIWQWLNSLTIHWWSFCHNYQFNKTDGSNLGLPAVYLSDSKESHYQILTPIHPICIYKFSMKHALFYAAHFRQEASGNVAWPTCFDDHFLLLIWIVTQFDMLWSEVIWGFFVKFMML